MSLKKRVDDKLDLRKYKTFEESERVISSKHKVSQKDLWFDTTQEAPFTIYGKVVSDTEVEPYRHEFMMEFDSLERALEVLEDISKVFDQQYEVPEGEVSQRVKNRNEQKVLDIVGSEEVSFEKISLEADIEEEELLDVVNRLLSNGTLIQSRPKKVKRL